MNKTAIIALICGLGTSVWTWWPDAKPVAEAQQEDAQVLTATGAAVDANAVAQIRVVKLDSTSKTPIPFEVRRKDGQWLIPSHFDYPADGGTRVGATAGAVLNVPLGPRASNDKSSHGLYGVLDPMTPGTSSDVGIRVTLSDEGGSVLVDVIIGKQKDGTEVYFVRRANEDAVYTAAIKPDDMKTTFADWVETDLLKICKDELRAATIKDYSVDESTGMVKPRATVQLSKSKSGSGWEILPPTPGRELNDTTLDGFKSEIEGLKLVGVRPYSNAWLQDRGFYVSQGGRQLFGNEGEVQLVAQNGLIYRLFFGEIALGDADDKSAQRSTKVADQGAEHNRYMAVFVQYAKEFDETIPQPAFAKTPPAEIAGSTAENPGSPGTTAENQADIDKAVADGAKRAADAQARFQKFFYVISADSFKKLRPNVASFYKAAKAQKTTE
ncbi:MAG: DUF4340 domain-containing protein [Myxococcota bacterium]|nr:DUF4340 domain-containing protein [Myxococcota bacterium]